MVQVEAARRRPRQPRRQQLHVLQPWQQLESPLTATHPHRHHRLCTSSDQQHCQGCQINQVVVLLLVVVVGALAWGLSRTSHSRLSSLQQQQQVLSQVLQRSPQQLGSQPTQPSHQQQGRVQDRHRAQPRVLPLLLLLQ